MLEDIATLAHHNPWPGFLLLMVGICGLCYAFKHWTDKLK